jgi:L-fuconolactonase
MVTEADHQAWKPTDLNPYIRHILKIFGPQRCMFGSDWPVCLLAGTYDDVVGALQAGFIGFSGKTGKRTLTIKQE